MARIYAALIRKGIKTLEDVPARLRDRGSRCCRRTAMLNVYSRRKGWRNAAEPQLPRKGICLQRRHRPFVCGQRTGAGAAGHP